MSGVPPTENAESETGDERGRFVISPVVGREARRVSRRAAWVVDSTPRLDRRPAARYPDTTRGIAPYNDFVNGQVLLWSQVGRMRRTYWEADAMSHYAQHRFRASIQGLPANRFNGKR